MQIDNQSLAYGDKPPLEEPWSVTWPVFRSTHR